MNGTHSNFCLQEHLRRRYQVVCCLFKIKIKTKTAESVAWCGERFFALFFFLQLQLQKEISKNKSAGVLTVVDRAYVQLSCCNQARARLFSFELH